MKDSNLFSLDWKDALKGLLMAVLTPVFVVVQQSLNAGTLVFDWSTILVAALAGGVAYLTKNFFTAPQK
jgi:hypothetical protein